MMQENTPQTTESRAAPRRQLTLLDSTSIIVGIIIGSSIYESTPTIANCVPNIAWLMGVWLAGGLLTLVGALCYAELANAYPTEGGDYVYLTRGFGRKLGFLFAWVQFWIVRPGSVGALAYVFARYANKLWPLGDGPVPLILYAAGSIVILSGINLLGVPQGKWTQNLLTIVKFLGLAAVVVAGFCFGGSATRSVVEAGPNPLPMSLAMILIFYAYSGWNEMAYVGSEVRDPEKNILRALVSGTVAVTVLYLLLNLAFLYALGFQGLRDSQAVAADVLALGMGDWGSRLISVLICISALGAINGMVFTGARIFYAMGTEHRQFAWLGQWSSSRDTPVRSLVIQAAITVALTIGFGLTKNGFEQSIVFTAPTFWGFLFLVGVALFVLRRREPNQPRPYRVPLYPLVPLIFCASSAFMFYSSTEYALEKQFFWTCASVGVLVLGFLFSLKD